MNLGRASALEAATAMPLVLFSFEKAPMHERGVFRYIARGGEIWPVNDFGGVSRFQASLDMMAMETIDAVAVYSVPLDKSGVPIGLLLTKEGRAAGSFHDWLVKARK